MNRFLSLILIILLTLSTFSAFASEEIQLVALCDTPLLTGPGYSDEHIELDWISKGELIPYKSIAFAEDGSIWYYTAYYGVAGYVCAEDAEIVSSEQEPDTEFKALMDANARTIAAGYSFTVAIKNDGRPVATGDNSRGQLDISAWSDLVSVSAGAYHTVGLKSDGTVLAAGDNSYGQLNVSYWKDVVAVSAGKFHTVGLRSDGTVLAAGRNDEDQLDVSRWTDICMIAAGSNFTLAIDNEGYAHATGLYDAYSYGAGTPANDAKRDYYNITMIDANQTMMGGVRSDGSVVLDGTCRYELLWEGFSAAEEIAIGGAHIAIRTFRDVVVSSGANGNNQCNTVFWDDIVEIDAGAKFTIGLKSDGTMLATGNNDYGQCNVAGFSDIRMPSK